MEDEAELVVPPTSFQRMLSWQLSQVQCQEAVSARESKKRLKKEKLRRAKDKERAASESDHDSSGDEEGGVVTNNESDDEMYYSAPESPLTSSDSDLDSSDVILDDQAFFKVYGSTSRKKSKKARKKMTAARRLARKEFFQPLCDLLDSERELTIDVSGMDISNQAAVPSLTTLCLRLLKKLNAAKYELELPYLFHVLIGQEKELSSIVAHHVHWLEKYLATIEIGLPSVSVSKHKKKNKEDDEEKELPKQAFIVQSTWPTGLQVITEDDLSHGFGYHALLPNANQRHNYCVYVYRKPEYFAFVFRNIILHFANYLYPCSPPNSSSSCSSERCVQRVNYWLNTRYPKLSEGAQEAMKLWPAYIQWSRGNHKVAINDFQNAIEHLTTNCDKAIALTEIARMCTHFGERSSAVNFYRMSTDITFLPPTADTTSTNLTKGCTLALQASVWDTGLLDSMSAGSSADSWAVVMKNARTSYPLPPSVWFLHVAAADSLLSIHAGRFTPSVHAPNNKNDVESWLSHCEQFLKENLSFPILYYHLSLVYAMMRKASHTKTMFDRYLNEFALFQEWNNRLLPGYQFKKDDTPFSFFPSPWQPLTQLLEQSKYKHAPILPLKWRLQLLHPLHPYLSGSEVNYIADHTPLSSTDLGLRLTSNGSYLTADIHMSSPPMRCVLIDPYTGNLCFSRDTSLQHFTYNKLVNYYCNSQKEEESSLPWPMRVLETQWCVVELLMAQKLTTLKSEQCDSNYLAKLHWYGTDGTHHELDLRKLIRKEMKKVFLETARRVTYLNRPIEAVEQDIDKMFESGLALIFKNLSYKKMPNDQKFILHLDSHLVFGKATLLLSFYIGSTRFRGGPHPHVLVVLELIAEIMQHVAWSSMMASSKYNCQQRYTTDNIVDKIYREEFRFIENTTFVNCQNGESFLKPVVHCDSTTANGFISLQPQPQSPAYHLKHVKYSSAVLTSTLSHDSIRYSKAVVVFDEDGHKCCQDPRLNQDHPCYHSFGTRLVELDVETNQLSSWSITYCRQCDKRHTRNSATVVGSNKLLSVPGLALVVCDSGLCVIHPGSLHRVAINGLKEDDTPNDGSIHPQFPCMNPKVSILKVVNVECEDNRELYSHEGTVGGQVKKGIEYSKRNDIEDDVNDHVLDDKEDYGSCRVAIAVDDRFLLLHCSPRTENVTLLLDITLPGRPTDFHCMPKCGYLICSSQFPNDFKDDLYWFSQDGQLQGMLPCLNGGRHSFFSTDLPPRHLDQQLSGEEDSHNIGGLHVFFDDCRGGICCLKPMDRLY